MSQISASISTVTSTMGKVWENQPVNPKQVVRAICGVYIYIDSCDRNRYPAIAFVLNTETAPTQYWVYDSLGSMQADCDIVNDAIGTPNNDYLAYWDTDFDNLPNTGDGFVVDADYLGGASGTHQADMLFFDETGIPNPMPVPYDAILEMRGVGNPYNIADFDAANGSNLATGGNWSGTYAAQVAANMVGTVGHTNLMQFAKLPFAISLNLIYSAAIELRMKIKARKNGFISGNLGNILAMPIKTKLGTLFSNFDLDVANYGKTTIIHSSNFINEASTGQGINDVRADNTWSKNNFLSNMAAFGVSSGGVFARSYYEASTDKYAVLWSLDLGATTPRRSLLRSYLKFDTDGFPIYLNPVDIGAIGSTAGSADVASSSRVAVVEALYANEMPLLLICKSSVTKTASLVVNTGTAAAPNYSSFLATLDIDASLTGFNLSRADSQGRIYCTPVTASQIDRLEYSGANNDAAALVNVANWARNSIGVAAATSPALSGDGTTAQFRPNAITIQEDAVVNGEPTLWMTDGTNHVVFRITRNANSFGDGRDWDFDLVVGQSGTAGNVDGIGTAATLNQPLGIDYDPIGGLLYVNCRGSLTMRTIDPSTLQVTHFIGQTGVGGQSNQFAF